ncbi:MAG TPA: alkyl sulfatase dimerization domain-containing protein [Candidatus Acidoferrales bacterium]|nr:alkyl sulfatase dimerization domain-containing protein [Candidatus Acidoferrales bacterium]
MLTGCRTREATTPPTRATADSDVVAENAVVLPKYSEVVYDSGTNLAYDQPAATIRPELTEHSRRMVQRIYRTASNVYCAVGWGLANMTMIDGVDGVIIVDTLESVDNARQAFAALRRFSDKPVKAIVYTHNHYDHVMGALGLVSAEDVNSGAVPVFAHATMMRGLLNQLSVVGEAVGIRSLYSFGAFLPKDPTGSVNEGIGPTLVHGPTGFIPPTKTFADRLAVTIAGIDLELIYAPSETDDEIVVWLPKEKLLQSAEVIQGETYPNLYTIRGTTYRDPVKWYETIDRLRELEPEYLVPSHGRPVEGKAAVESLLAAYRDAIQFTHDQAVRLINQGHTPDEIVTALPALPPHLAAHPWVREFYGTVKHSVRNVYNGYLGWFQGDPTTLNPTAPVEQARRYIELMGGRDAVVRAARKAEDGGDHQWCAELLTHVIRTNPGDTEARALKAAALRQLGYQQANINWRNFYLTAALELDEKLDLSRYDIQGSIAMLSRLPLVNILEKLVTRIDAEKSKDMHMTLAFHVDDRHEVYGLEIRRGVVQLHRKQPPQADLTLSGNEDDLRALLLQQASFLKQWALGRIKLDGSTDDLTRFFSYFDRRSDTPPKLVVR